MIAAVGTVPDGCRSCRYKNRLFHHLAERKKDKGREEGKKQVAYWAEQLEGMGGARRAGEGLVESTERKASEVEVVLRVLLRMVEGAARGSGGDSKVSEVAECGKKHMMVVGTLMILFSVGCLLMLVVVVV